MNDSSSTPAPILCRHCGAHMTIEFLDLGFAPPSNAYLSESDLSRPEVHFPLRLFVCDQCWLVQTQDFASAEELFQADYAYFSSVSASWRQHAEDYVDMIVGRLGLNDSSFVVELASNDGYLLRHFVERDIPCLGVEPTLATARAARELGVETVTEFFGEALASTLAAQRRAADLIIGNNVFAHVPDILDFTKGIARLLAVDGIVTLEFPHVLELIENKQFDTVYHEHFSYLSLLSAERVFASAGLRIFDVQQLPTHGGSLRIYGCHDDAAHVEQPAVSQLRELESGFGIGSADVYTNFQSKVEKIKHDLLTFLLDAKRNNKTVFAYGAAAKGNTLLNYSGVSRDLLAGVCDAAPSKQGKYLPGSHLAISAPDVIAAIKPDYVIVLPWNLIDEVEAKLSDIRSWGGQFVTAIPSLRVF